MLLLYILAAALSALLPGFLALGQFRARKRPLRETGGQPISVVIAARDEAAQLPALLDAVLGQDFGGEYEVLLVLDRCRDHSAEIVRERARTETRLRMLEIDETPAGWTGKKWALEQGIAAARHERIALTDADCVPEPGWLRGIADQFDRGNELVLGLGLYRRAPGLLNAFVRFETHLTAMQYMGWAGWGLPYMGVGRNMAYTRAFFRRAGGLSSISGRLSGDDDLLVNRHARAGSTAIMTRPGTRTLSTAPDGWKAWWRQKIRHLSAGTGYRPRTQLILSGGHGLQLIFYLSLVGVLCSGRPPELLWGIYAGRTVLAAMGWNAGKDFRMDPHLWPFFPLLDLFYLLYNLIMTPASLVIKPKWRGK